jgi:esterase
LKLNFRQFSDTGEPLLILHGLFGSLSNWSWHSRRFAEHFAVIALDMRNHGASPHSSEMSYPAMAADVLEFLDDQAIDAAHVLGHSMGGKVAMQLALSHPERIRRLVVADVAPVRYGGERGEHDEIFEGLGAIDLTTLDSRSAADHQLAAWVEDEVVRQFLLSNLVRSDNGDFAWRINLPVLRERYADMRGKPDSERPYPREVLFVRGDQSDYITEHHRDEILALFPHAKIKTIMQAGHWLHAEKPETFNRIVRTFLQSESDREADTDIQRKT